MFGFSRVKHDLPITTVATGATPEAAARPGDDDRESATRRALRLVTTAWAFGAAWMFTVQGAAMTRYAKMLGLPQFWFGVFAALPFIGALAQLPASFFIERFGHRKTLFVAAGVCHRTLWIGVALIPWVLPGAWWWPALMVLSTTSYFAGHLSGPAWVSWMADLVPARIRGRYFAQRNQVGQVSAVCATLAAGYALDLAQAASLEMLMRTGSVVLALAGISGTVDYLMFTAVPDATATRANASVNLWRLVREPLRDRNFRRLLGFNAALTFSIAYVSQFVWLYLFDVMHLSNTKANLMWMVMQLGVWAVSYPLWGRIIDKAGRKPVLLVAGLIFAFSGAAWIFVTREHWVAGYIAVIVATAAWPGLDLANFSLLLAMSTSRGGRRQSSACVAINNFVVGIAGTVSGLVGGIIAQTLRDWHTTIFGWPLTYHGVLFLLTFVMRLVAVAWAMRLEEPRAHGPRVTLRYLSADVYSNIQQVFFAPARLLWHVGRWTLRISRER